MIEYSGISCGVHQITDVCDAPDSEDVIRHVWLGRIYGDYGDKHLRDGAWPAYYVFSDIDDTDRAGYKLVDFIKKHKLGKVYKSKPKVNPNSLNPIVIWTWDFDHAAINKYAEKHKFEKTPAEYGWGKEESGWWNDN